MFLLYLSQIAYLFCKKYYKFLNNIHKIFKNSSEKN